jgi:hypothetical protein
MKPRQTRKKYSYPAVQRAKTESVAKLTINLPSFEINQVLNAPLALELEIAAQLMIKLIKELPSEAQLGAIIAAVAEIHGLEGTAESIVSQFPRVPHQYSNQVIQHQTELMQKYLATHLNS